MNTQGNRGGTAGNGQSSVGQRVDSIGDSAQQLFTEARGAVTDLGESLDLKGRVDRHPYLSLAAAAGLGYVLGGGLFTPLTARIFRIGVKLAALPFVKDELLGMAEAAVDSIASQKGLGGPGGAAGSPGTYTGPGAQGPSGS